MTALAFPVILYGPTAQVRKAAGKAATKILRENTLQFLIEGPHIDVASHPGSVVLARRWITPRANEPNYHADLLWKELERRVFGKLTGEELFARLSQLARMGLSEAWWFAGLLESESYFVVSRAVSQLEFLDHAREHWSTLLSVGNRYSPTSSLETSATLVNFCLARQGAPITKPPFLPLTVPRLEVLLDDLPGFQVRELLAQGNVDDAFQVLEGHDEVPLLSLAEHFVEFGHDDLVCETLRRRNLPDPHGIVRKWLARAGDSTRTVS